MCETVQHGNILFSVRHHINGNHLLKSLKLLGNDALPNTHTHTYTHTHTLPRAVVTLPEIKRKWCGSKVLNKVYTTKLQWENVLVCLHVLYNVCIVCKSKNVNFIVALMQQSGITIGYILKTLKSV